MSERICSIEGCDNLCASRGWCKLHYQRWTRTGSTDAPGPRKRQSLEERFWGKVSKTNSCWLWTGALNPQTGYGTIFISWLGNNRQKTQTTHRLVWELMRGPIPDGLTIDHLCRVRSCCNPDHLEPVTLAENTRRSPKVGRGRTIKTHCRQGHLFDEENTVRTTKGTRRCRACRDAYMREYLVRNPKDPEKSRAYMREYYKRRKARKAGET